MRTQVKGEGKVTGGEQGGGEKDVGMLCGGK